MVGGREKRSMKAEGKGNERQKNSDISVFVTVEFT